MKWRSGDGGRKYTGAGGRPIEAKGLVVVGRVEGGRAQQSAKVRKASTAKGSHGHHGNTLKGRSPMQLERL